VDAGATAVGGRAARSFAPLRPQAHGGDDYLWHDRKSVSERLEISLAPAHRLELKLTPMGNLKSA
jgi:hypothetical protein